MRPRQIAWSLAAGAHLLLAVCGAAGMAPSGDGLPMNLLMQYADLSGADSSYGFFAPAVSSQCRAVLTMKDAAGKEWQESLFQDSSSVFGLRSATSLDSFVRLPTQVQRGLAGSWAGVMFGRHPGATEVTVGVDIQLLPGMAEWRAGTRSTWKSLYQGTFVRKA